MRPHLLITFDTGANFRLRTFQEYRHLRTKFEPQQVAESVWIAPNATVLGNVSLANQSSVWFGAVIRGDTERIAIGRRSNVQDLSCLHADPGLPCLIGDDVTIGHGAIVHGAIISDRVLIGIRAVVLNGAVVGEESIVAAGAVVLEGQQIPPRSLVVGIPARVVRTVTEEDVARIIHGAQHYVTAAAEYAGGNTASDSCQS
jgi:carbonic anhydrase/acetyltransferase-like protein (isoleucine patch superfamily)